MKKIINPWEGLDGYMCFGCAPSNPMGLHMEFYEDGDDIVAYWEPEAHYQGWLNTSVSYTHLTLPTNSLV